MYPFIRYKEFNMQYRYLNEWVSDFPKVGIDLGYSAKQASCGFACEGVKEVSALQFGACINVVADQIIRHGPHHLIVEAVLSTYHRTDGNPDLRGSFEKGRGWYHGPGVSTFAAAHRFLSVLDTLLPPGIQLPLTEGFLSYKTSRSTHTDDAQRLIVEYSKAESFIPCEGSTPICATINAVPKIRRYNRPKSEQC